MSKKYLLISIGIIVIVVFSICIKCGKNDLPTTSYDGRRKNFARVLEKC